MLVDLTDVRFRRTKDPIFETGSKELYKLMLKGERPR
jgi:hypothetical protein